MAPRQIAAELSCHSVKGQGVECGLISLPYGRFKPGAFFVRGQKVGLIVLPTYMTKLSALLFVIVM